MFSQLFGRYLVDKSLLQEDDYKKIIDKQLSVRVKLGTIAVSEGLLTEEQVETINELQKQRDQRFGDIAISEGLLTNEQIIHLLSMQGNSYMQFIELLQEVTDFTNAQIEEQLLAFQKKNGFSDNELDALKDDNLDSLIPIFIFSARPHVSNIAGLLIRNLLRFVSRDFYIGRAVRAKDFEYKSLAIQKMNGNDTVCVALADNGDGSAFKKIAAGFSRMDIGNSEETILDIICEFINTTNGLYASESSRKDIHLDMEPPKAYRNQIAEGDFYVLPINIEGYPVSLLISVNSEFKAGSVSIRLNATPDVVSKNDNSTGKGTIVVVDDSKMQREILDDLLTKAGYSVVAHATNGLEGLEAYKKYSPDLITLDITMPEMDGIEALRNIIDYNKDANVIMITAAGQQDKLIEALKIGAKRFISKPFKEEEVLHNVNDLFASE